MDNRMESNSSTEELETLLKKESVSAIEITDGELYMFDGVSATKDGKGKHETLLEEDVTRDTIICCPEHLKCFTKHNWLPIKIHYFLLFGSVAGVLPFMAVIGKDLGLSATAVGITYTLQSLFIFLFKPLFGYLADYFQNIKSIVICLVTGTILTLFAIIFIEPLQKNSHFDLEIHLQYEINKTELYSKLSSHFDEACVRNVFTLDKINCEILHEDEAVPKNITKKSSKLEVEFSCTCDDAQPLTDCDNPLNSTSLNCFISFSNNISETNDSKYHCENVFESCLVPGNNESNIATNPSFFKTYQFWCYSILFLAAGTFYASSLSLTDVACYDILGKKKEYYGRQRLWGTLSTGIVSFITGYFDDFMIQGGRKTEYLAGYYILFAFFVLNMILLTYMKLPKSKFSKTIISDTKKFFRSLDIIVYGVAVFFIGNFSGLVANYLFWYLRELGASQTVLGLTITSQCLTAELPFFFFAGWIIKRLGYFNCLTCSFAAFSLRFGLYTLLQNPWLTLPIEVLHGFTFAIFYASKTSFVSVYSPPGTEGTLLGILSGLCDGLGIASGSFLGGLGFDRIGGNRTFLIASILSFFCATFTFISHFVFKKRPSRETVASS